MNALSICSLQAAMLFMACDSDVDGNRKLSELSDDEARDACEDLVEDFPEKTVECSDGRIIKIGVTQAECSDNMTAPAECTATVDDARECAEDTYNQSDEELCTVDDALPESCAKLIPCN